MSARRFHNWQEQVSLPCNEMRQEKCGGWLQVSNAATQKMSQYTTHGETCTSVCFFSLPRSGALSLELYATIIFRRHFGERFCIDQSTDGPFWFDEVMKKIQPHRLVKDCNYGA